jgi:nucleotidyltransferase/DNA polymerase involved in DNA repair
VRIICLLAPHLPVQVERQADHALDQRPLVVGGRPWDAGAVLDCCAQASAAGVRPGMRLAQAEHLCPTARFVRHVRSCITPPIRPYGWPPAASPDASRAQR